MLMNIDITASQTDSSYITLPPSRSRESGQASFMVERKYGREMTPADLSGAATNIKYMVSLNASPLVNIEVILDELTGDVIRGRGSGNLRISSGTSEPLSIRGRYEIEEGSYLFTFQSFFKKPFIIKPGSNNYIDWTGDPYGATIHFDAIYTAENVSFAPLVGSVIYNISDREINYASYRADVNVVATLTGELFRPTFSFRFEFPPNSQAANDQSIALGLQQIERNPNELNKQVTYLIVFNSFAPYESTTGAGTAFNEFAYNTISGLLFGEVNKQLNRLLSRILRTNDISFNLSGSLYNRDIVNRRTNFINQSNLNFSVGVPFFSERFIVSFGSTFEIPVQTNIQQNVQFLPDVNAQWLINPSGSIRATFFYRQNLDFIAGSGTSTGLVTTRTGANIAYRKEFEHLGNRHRKNKKGAVKETVPDSTSVSR
jgi:hypothetical protein